MWNSSSPASPASDLAIGKYFIEKLLYVQHVDKEKDPASEIPEPTLQHLLASDDRKAFHDSNSTENVGNSESNLNILKSSLKDRIDEVVVYSNPLPISLGSSSRVMFHAFVVFATLNTKSRKKMCWSLEKNGKYIVLQQSTEMDDVVEKLYDAEKGQSVERYGRVKIKKFAMGNFKPLEDLMRVIWETNQISDPYHFLYSNCQNFASFIFEKLNGERKKWSTGVSAIVDLLRVRKKKPGSEVNAVMFKSIVKDDKFDYCKAMMEGRTEDFEKLTNDLTIEFLNSVDSQGYTLLEWATVFSTSHWPFDEELKKKGAAMTSGQEESFRRNVFFIALQYLPPNKKLELFDSLDGIDMNGVNETGDTALHLSLYGEKWKIAEKILQTFEDFDVNSTNFLGETPLHLAAKLKSEFGLFKKILNQTNSENVNKVDENGWTALHYAMDKQSETKVKELLNHMHVDFNVQNNEDNCTALHLASKWPTIPADLFKIILKKTTDKINAQDVNGNTALHCAIFTKSETAVKQLLNHNDVNVNVANNEKVLPLHWACICENIPMDSFKIILEKTDDINAQDEDGFTALHYAIDNQSEMKLEKLLTHKDVNVNVKDNGNLTALHLASCWKNIPMDLFEIILKRSTDINAQNEYGWTALHFAIHKKSDTQVEIMLANRKVYVNIKGNFNITPLHLAARWTDIPIDLFKIILKRSTFINARDIYGDTALQIASRNHFQGAIKVLLEDDRVDVNVEDNKKLTALRNHHYLRKRRIIILIILLVFLLFLCIFFFLLVFRCHLSWHCAKW
jgi:ankyrin repeat protein